MCDLTVVVPIYNEAQRLAFFLRSIPTDVPVLLLDKGSNDESILIAKTFDNVQILNLPFGPPSSEFSHLREIKDQLSTEWCLMLVVSQTLDLSLFCRLKEIIKDNQNDVIELPFRTYTFGMYEEYNPWPSTTHKPLLSKVKVINFQPRVHQELIFKSNKVAKLGDEFGRVHHNSNINLESFIEKSLNYARQEADEYRRLNIRHPGTSRPLRYILKSLINGYLRRKLTVFRGQRGILLGTAFVLTQLLILLFVTYGNKDDDAG
jgi:glycosyltransferase involved in cell wall biosynthesis